MLKPCCFFLFLFYNTIATCQHKLDYYHLQMSPHPFNPGSVVLRSDKMGQFLTIYRKALLSSTLPSDLRFTHNAHAKTTREKLLKREMDTPSKQISSVFSDIQLRCKGWINMLIDGRRFMIALSEKKGKRSLYFKVNGKTVKCQWKVKKHKKINEGFTERFRQNQYFQYLRRMSVQFSDTIHL